MTEGTNRRPCLACGRNWKHCHGTVILHADGELECTTDDSRCVAAVEVHDLVVPCDQLMSGCGCLTTTAVPGT